MDTLTMDTRITKLEASAERTDLRLLAIERDVAVIRSNYVTKTDLATEIASVRLEIASVRTALATLESTMLKWFIGTAIALSGVVFSIGRYLH